MQQEISSAEFAELAAYLQLEPLESERADIRNALLCKLVSAGFGGGNQPLSRFIISFDEEVDEDGGVPNAALFEKMMRAQYGNDS